MPTNVKVMRSDSEDLVEQSMCSMSGVSIVTKSKFSDIKKELLNESDISLLCMDGVYEGQNGVSYRDPFQDMQDIITVDQLKFALKLVFENKDTCFKTKEKNIARVLSLVKLTPGEVNKYTFIDPEKSYTRNLILTDNINYTLLLLCWNNNRESSIHNHPADGCFIKTLSGCLREVQYKYISDNELVKTKTSFIAEGQVSYIVDQSLHKIGNPLHQPALSLHLYTPPFGSCLSWSDPNSAPVEVKMGFYSCYGKRTPYLEGKPSKVVYLLQEIQQKVKTID